jgi:thioester reductase-like protein
VELGDVASVLAEHPLVGSAIAVVVGTGAKTTLVGCATPRSAQGPPSTAELRRHAEEKLPAEHVPQRIVLLDSLPLNRNGKADRKAVTAFVAQRQAGPDGWVEPPADPMEELICSAWCEVLGRDQVCVETPFSAYGGDSLVANQLTVAVSERLGKPVRTRELLAAATVRAQAARLTDGTNADVVDLAYIKHDLEWSPPRTLLLTGATGFVGAHILAELLTDSTADLICLVRCENPADGARRVTETLERYRLTAACRLLPGALENGRLEVLPGDLGSELLGLAPSRFDAIASTVCDVVNAGGAVNFLSGYLDHRPTNVLGVQELVKLAAGGARVHSLSTFSIFPPGPVAAPITEDRLPDPDEVASDGYNSSKYVAENVLETARRQGIGTVTYRLGEVWPHQATGVANPDSLAHNLLYACARTGCVFPTSAETDVTPVDVVGRFVARAATGVVEVPDGTMHVLWPRTLRFADGFAALADRCGLEPVGYERFRDRLAAVADADDRLARVRVLLPPPDPGDDAAPAAFDQMFTDSSRQFDTRRFSRCGVSLAQPEADWLGALDSYLAALADVPVLVPQERR